MILTQSTGGINTALVGGGGHIFFSYAVLDDSTHLLDSKMHSINSQLAMDQFLWRFDI